MVKSRERPEGGLIVGRVIRPGCRRAKCFRWAMSFALLVLALSILPRAVADQWPGWRGVAREGRSQSESGPLHWSDQENVEWRTCVPGRGHSSPVVSEDSIFLTTGYLSKEDADSKLLLDIILYVGVLVVAGSTVCMAARFCRNPPSGAGQTHQWFLLVAFSQMAVIFILLILFGENFFGLRVGPNRRWVFCSVVAAMGLSAGVMHRSSGRTYRLVMGVLALALAVFIFVGIPCKQGVFFRGFNRNWKVMVAVIALPVTVGLFYISGFLARLSGKASPAAGSRLAGSARFGKYIIVVLVLGALAMLGRAAFASGQYVTYPIVPIVHQPILEWYFACAGAAVLAAVFVARRLLGRSFPVNLMTWLCLLAVSTLAVFMLVEQAFAHSPYLTYYIYTGSPNPTPVFGHLGLAGLIGFCVLCLLVTSVAGSFRRGLAKTGMPISLWIVAPLLGLFYFASIIYLGQKPVYVHAIICVDRHHGGIKWIRDCARMSRKLSSYNSPATPTAVLDENRVYAYFGSAGLVCCDFRGNILWVCKELPFESRYGVATSPVICDGKVIILGESSKLNSPIQSYLAAVDCRTGKVLWKIQRPSPDNDAGNCRTPFVKEINGRKVIVVWGMWDLAAYDPASGAKVWAHEIENLTIDVVSCAVSDEQRIYLPGLRKILALAIDKLGTDEDPLVWSRPFKGVNCASPVLANGLLFLVADNGTACCLDARTGEICWRKRFKGRHYPSPIVIGENIYFCSNRGVTTVVSADRTFRKIAVNALKEKIHASFVPVDGKIIIRTMEHLYCIR